MRREKGYSSRVELMLLENKDVPIVICDAGKNHEGSGGFIVYTIRTGVGLPAQFLASVPQADEKSGGGLCVRVGPRSASQVFRV